MRLPKTCLCMILLAIVAYAEVAWAESRVALVIGNSAYQQVGELPNPANDAADVAGALSRMGFSVTHRTDLDHEALRGALRQFGRDAAGADFAVVFFAGHGIEIDNRNFLLPIDARLAVDTDVEFEAVPLDLVMASLSGVSGIRVVLLDACRNNPFLGAMKRTVATRSIGRGLAGVEPPAGTLIGYAAKEGTVASDGNGRNSPYTAALLAHMEEPGLDIQFMFRKVRDSVLDLTRGAQEPFTYGSLPGKQVVLNLRAAVPISGDGQGVEASATEIEFWNSAKVIRNRRAIERYLQVYPNGAFAEIARMRLQEMEEPSAAAAPDAEGTAPDRADLARQVQRELKRVGCDPGTPDGIWGPASRRALRRFVQHSGAALSDAEPSGEVLEEVARRGDRVCPAVAAKEPAASPSVKKSKAAPAPAGKRTAVTPATGDDARRKVCRAETHDECRVRARAAGARRGSGFCRNRLTICS